MKKYICICVCVLIFQISSAQIIFDPERNQIPYVDTLFIKKELSKHKDLKEGLSLSKNKDFIKIGILDLQLDSIKNEILVSIRRNELYIYVPRENKTYIYTLTDRGSIFLLPIDSSIDRTFSTYCLRGNDQNVDCLFYIPSLFMIPPPHKVNPFFDFLFCYRKNDGNYHFLDANYNKYGSFNKLIEYKFGNSDNYIEAYNKRIEYNDSLNLQIIKKQKEISPNNGDSKIRIRR